MNRAQAVLALAAELAKQDPVDRQVFQAFRCAQDPDGRTLTTKDYNEARTLQLLVEALVEVLG